MAPAFLPGSDPATDLFPRAADEARRAGTARAIFTFTLDAPPGFEREAGSFGGQAELDFAAGRSGAVVSFTGALGGDGPTGEVPGQVETTLVADDGELLGEIPTGVAGERFLAFGAGDVGQTLDYLRGASAPEEIGEEPVGDAGATHYRARVDLERALARTPGPRRDRVAGAAARFRREFGAAAFPADVWIDGDGRPRRLRFEFDLADHDATGRIPEGAIMSFTMELFDYGRPVTIGSPPREGA